MGFFKHAPTGVLSHKPIALAAAVSSPAQAATKSHSAFVNRFLKTL
jgi:hypothetical protein